MPAAVIPIHVKTTGAKTTGAKTTGGQKHGVWSLLEIARPGEKPAPFGILLAERESDLLFQRLSDAARVEDLFDELEEQESDVLAALDDDLAAKGREMGAERLLAWLEDSLSHFLRLGERTAIAWSGDPQTLVDRLFEEHVDSSVRPYITHLPYYSIRAAATRFGESFAKPHAESETGAGTEWLRVPAASGRLTEGMFIAEVVGASMEPLIPDGSRCIFKAPVTGSRNGRNLLIEHFGETDYAARYTVKRYARRGRLREGEERAEPIRLEPLNPAFEPFELLADEFRVIAEFVRVL